MYVLVFNLIPLINVSVLCQIHTVFYYYNYVHNLKSVILHAVLSLLRTILAILGLLFLNEAENCIFKVCEEFCWDFDGDCPECLQIAFGRLATFTMLILSIHGHGRSFTLLIASSIYVFKDWRFLSFKSFTCLVRIIFKDIMKGVVSLISFSVHLSFTY